MSSRGLLEVAGPIHFHNLPAVYCLEPHKRVGENAGAARTVFFFAQGPRRQWTFSQTIISMFSLRLEFVYSLVVLSYEMFLFDDIWPSDPNNIAHPLVQKGLEFIREVFLSIAKFQSYISHEGYSSGVVCFISTQLQVEGKLFFSCSPPHLISHSCSSYRTSR